MVVDIITRSDLSFASVRDVWMWFNACWNRRFAFLRFGSSRLRTPGTNSEEETAFITRTSSSSLEKTTSRY
ncbi:uncharacterized [Tachysurus ichikawai]